MSSSLSATMQWFEMLATNKWAQSYAIAPDLSILRVDPNYGRKLFVQYACTRKGAPHALEVSAIKAIAECARRGESPSRISDHFMAYYHGSLLLSHNPLLDPRFATFDTPRIVDFVAQGDMRQAFLSCELNGTGHKVRALFLRDIAIRIGAERRPQWQIEEYLFCQPIDVWAKTIAALLPKPPDHAVRLVAAQYSLSREDLGYARSVIHHSLQSGVSPLRVSQGMWFFARNVVADKTRLVRLVSTFDPQLLQAELDLLEGFLP